MHAAADSFRGSQRLGRPAEAGFHVRRGVFKRREGVIKCGVVARSGMRASWCRDRLLGDRRMGKCTVVRWTDEILRTWSSPCQCTMSMLGLRVVGL